MAELDVHEHQSFRTSSTGVRYQCDEYHSLQGAISLTMGIIDAFLIATAANSAIVRLVSMGLVLCTV